MHLAALPDRRAESAPDRMAVSDDHIAYTNAGFLDAVRRAAAAMAGRGVRPGAVVAVMLPNRAAFVVAMFAAWRLGAVVTPISPTLVAAEREHQIADSGAVVLLAERDVDTDIPVLSVDDLDTDPWVAEPAPNPDDALALLIYTSGTTGRPKGVMLDHRNVNAMCAMVIEGFELTAADHSLLILPLFHVNAIVVSTLAPLIAGGRTTIAGRFDPVGFFDRVEASRASYFSAVPTIYTMLAALPAEVTPDTSSIRFAVCGAAPASVELLEKFENRYGIGIIEGYGLSEGSCASTCNPLEGRRKPGTVGIPLPGQQIRIVDGAGTEVPAGGTGEVIIKGPNVMRGYLNRQADTAKTVVDGWLRTGDIGRFDEDGYLVLVDRAKDMIIRGGENIYPKEIETVAYRMPEVAEAAVIGRPSALYGEEPVLVVSLHAAVGVDAIDGHLRASLSKYKVPVAITVLDELPKNPVGKIDKPALRKAFAASRIDA
jgi:acyl-CoA synthetase (AMP-forming)/AMP-acid ligase II